MEQVLDNNIRLSEQEPIVIYGAFWPRLAALMLDTVILLPITAPLTIYNLLEWKSIPLQIAATLISLAYKPFCEYKFGATPGKMALGLKVVNLRFEKANLAEILLRNIFNLGIGLFSLILTMGLWDKEGFQEVHKFMEYSVWATQSQGKAWLDRLLFIPYLADLIFLLSDDKKRALHDRIGKTYVIKKG